MSLIDVSHLWMKVGGYLILVQKNVSLYLPFTGFTFTKTIVISKEVTSIEASDLFTNFNISKYFHTSSISSS